MQVICIDEPAFYSLLEQAVIRLKETFGGTQQKWVNEVEAMALLNIKSKTTLQKLRDEGKIRFSQPQKKIILYDRDSIMQYLDVNAKNTF